MPLPYASDSFFDYPDGQELGKKLWINLKNSAIFSVCVSTMDVLLYSHPKGTLETLGRFASVSAPLIGISTTFVVFTNCAANIRNKDDHLNWMIGGCAAGIVIGAWRRSTMLGFCSSLMLATYGYVQKDSLIHNVPLIDVKYKCDHGGIGITRRDWTLTKHRPGNWVSE